jgi:hypothetical protein
MGFIPCPDMFAISTQNSRNWGSKTIKWCPLGIKRIGWIAITVIITTVM